MALALGETRLEGVRSNIPLHRDILGDDAFRAGAFDIHHLERRRAAAEGHG
jgi:acetyl-CoA carboxylase biotin carboxylase subunit